MNAFLSKPEQITQNGCHHEKLHDTETDKDGLYRLQRHRVILSLPQLASVFDCHDVHLFELNEDLFDHEEGVDVDEDHDQDLQLAEEDEHFKAGLPVHIGVLDAMELLLNFIREKESKEPVKIQTQGNERNALQLLALA